MANTCASPREKGRPRVSPLGDCQRERVTCKSDPRSQTDKGWVELRVRAQGLLPNTADDHKTRQMEEFHVIKRKTVKMTELILN